MGPQLNPHISSMDSINTGNKPVPLLINGRYPAKMNLNFPIVDVRDVATAHILCMEKPSVGGRLLLTAHTIPFSDLCDYLFEI